MAIHVTERALSQIWIVYANQCKQRPSTGRSRQWQFVEHPQFQRMQKFRRSLSAIYARRDLAEKFCATILERYLNRAQQGGLDLASANMRGTFRELQWMLFSACLFVHIPLYSSTVVQSSRDSSAAFPGIENGLNFKNSSRLKKKVVTNNV